MKKQKPIYIHFSQRALFRKNDILKIDSSGDEYIVVNPDCKNQWWRKLLRTVFFSFFGIKVQDIDGLTKLQLHKKKSV